MAQQKIFGYANRISVRPGEEISFHVNCDGASEADAQQEISVPPAPINALLSGVLFLESVWLRHFDSPLGSSLLCLARKPV